MAKSALGQLAGQMPAVLVAVGRPWMQLRMSRDSDREAAELDDVVDQLAGVVVLTDGRHVGVCRRITPKGQDVLDSLGAVVDQDVADVGTGVPLAGEVGHRGGQRLPAHPRDEIACLGAGAAAGAVGDADEVGLQILELSDGVAEAQPAGLVLRREEFEREGPACGEEVGNPGHVPTSLPDTWPISCRFGVSGGSGARR